MGLKKLAVYRNRTRDDQLERSIRSPLHHQYEKSRNEKNCLLKSSLLICYGAYSSTGILNISKCVQTLYFPASSGKTSLNLKLILSPSLII